MIKKRAAFSDSPLFYLTRIISIRLFLARPSGVELSAIGNRDPKPTAVTRSGAMPLSRMYFLTLLARFSDNS